VEKLKHPPTTQNKDLMIANTWKKFPTINKKK